MSISTRRQRIVEAARAALARAPLHYTEGPERWNCVDNPLAWLYADCSSFATSCYRRAEEPDPNADNYKAGWTGTLSRHGVKLNLPTQFPRLGDLVFYGTGWPWKHVTVFVGNGQVISHGSEGGPRLLPIRYRSDLGEIRRYIFPLPLRPYYAVRVRLGRLFRVK